jgi:DNA-binding SARP family transcriptional activator
MTSRRPSVRTDLRVSLLGQLDVRTPLGATVSFTGRHAPALFAMLVLTRRPRTREAIAADLWPDSGAASTGTLRQALWLIRRGLSDAGIAPDQILDLRPDAIGLQPDARLEVDVDLFERCLDDPTCGLEQAVALYRGDLVEVLGHDGFAPERERLADRYEDALVTVSERRLKAGDVDGARWAAERALVRDPLREEAHATLIAVYGEVGSRSQVVRQYRRLSLVLARELGERPLPETDATYRRAMLDCVRRSVERSIALEPDRLPALVSIPR